MKRSGASLVGTLLALLSLLPPVAAGAQTTAGAIAGTVKDATGGVLPGVTVEASSPALIEKTRSVVSDGEGKYKITDLRPGTYAVTFTLPGFNTVKRDGIELTTGFTANINADLKVGSVEETITVSGQTPVVDVQNTKQQAVMTREVLDAIPAGGQMQNVGILIPGVALGSGARDVGGLSGQSQAALVIHGGRTTDQQQQVDGFPTYNWVQLQSTTFSFVQTDFQEFVFDTSSNGAEAESGGVRINYIPREGGNTAKGTFNGNYSPTSWVPANLDDSLRAQGLKYVNTIKRQYYVGGSVGGPIVKDKLWLFGAYTHQDNEVFYANSFYNSCITCWTYTPDLTRPAYRDQVIDDMAIRGTWQASARNKISTFWAYNIDGDHHPRDLGGPLREEATNHLTSNNYYYVGTWQSPVTNRLLFEVGAAASPQDQPYHWQGEDDGIAPQVQIADSVLNVTYRGPAVGGPAIWWNRNAAVRGSVSYVTGSHAIKVGTHVVRGALSRVPRIDLSYTAANGVPTGVTYGGWPVRQTNGVVSPQLGIYAQDQWTAKKLTVNAGVRFDYYHSLIYAQNNPPTKYVPVERDIPEIDGLHWKDLSPRFGVAYDLFGNGKTALKASVNRYVLAEGINFTQPLNPLANNNTVLRKWTDSNGDHVVQGDPLNPAANQELGVSTNLKFGQPATTQSNDPAWATGFNVRPADWEYSASIQQEVIPRVSFNAGFFRRQFTNFTVNENQAVSPSDYTGYCVTTPVDSRLPNGGGQQICGLYDLNLNKVGLINNVRTSASKFGSQHEHWQGFDLTVNARPKNVLLQGGLSTGKRVSDVCDIMTGHPNIAVTVAADTAAALTASPSATSATTPSTSTSQAFCHGETPWQTDFKLVASYTLPYAVTVAGTYQDSPGNQILSSGTFTAAQIQPSLGRAPSQQSTIQISMVPQGQMYVERLHQVDVRFGRNFMAGKRRFQAQLDIYNALNANQINLISSVYGSTSGSTAGAAWLVPQQIMAARIIKLGVQIDF